MATRDSASCPDSSIRHTLSRWYGSRLGVFFQSILIGVLAGIVVVLFRLLLEYSELFRIRAYGFLRTASPAYRAGWVLLVVAIGVLLGWISLKRPMIRGSGIPQIKGALLRKMRLEWLPELPLKIVTGVLGIGFGLSLGREGPSVQIGAYVGKGVLGIARRPAVERKYLITSGAAAGLAAAFNAPLAGVLFALEELHKHFSPLLLACAMGASVAGDFVASRFFGLGPAFDFHQIIPLPVEMLPWVILLGALCALLGDAFKRSLYAAQDLYPALRIPPILRPAFALLVSVPLGFFLFDVTGGGHALIETLWRENPGIGFLALLFVSKMAFSALSYGSGTAGGIFLPLLACGALTGKLYGMVLADLGLAPTGNSLNFMILGMAAFFTGVVRAPVTGAILILEMSGNFNHFASLMTACLVAFVVGDLIRSKPVYDVLLERLLARNPGAFKPVHGRKLILEIPVAEGSRLSHKLVRDVPWPSECLVVGVERGEDQLIPRGATKIHPGDQLHVLVDEEDAAEVKEALLGMGERAGEG
ncbi:MAG: ClC family H(+)/Cl(-) exchange transporter [Treponema sp.]|nr:ClC family H(+)/Cl(-) exchange transporter [Treponema sp.]